MRYILLLVPLLVGMGVVVQSGANTQLRHILANPFLAGLISFSMGTLVLTIVNLVLKTDFSVLSSDTIQRTQWWMWLGGLLGSFFIMSVIFVAPKIGPTKLFGLLIASQLVFSVVVDHFGWMGFEVQPVSVRRVIGITLLIAGAFLVQSEGS